MSKILLYIEIVKIFEHAQKPLLSLSLRNMYYSL